MSGNGRMTARSAAGGVSRNDYMRIIYLMPAATSA